MTKSLPYTVTFRSDLEMIYARLRPRTVGCFDLADLSIVPLEVFARGGCQACFVDGRAGRVQAMLATEIARIDGRGSCLACSAAADGKDICASHDGIVTDAGSSCSRCQVSTVGGPCTQFVPGRKLRVIHGDGGGGRAAGFATRVETVVARAATPSAAVERAISVCKRSGQMNIPLPLEDGALDLVISVLAPSRMMEQPYAYFEGLMNRRFGAWTENQPAKLIQKVHELKIALFRTQLDAHVRELARLTHPRRGRLYFATVPVEPGPNGAWSLERGVTECFDTLGHHFVFDFESFPPEAFLRRPLGDPSIVLQAALLSPKPPHRDPSS